MHALMKGSKLSRSYLAFKDTVTRLNYWSKYKILRLYYQRPIVINQKALGDQVCQ
jgi:hypothetical protein